MKTIAVVGAGTMGSGIAQKAAQEGFEVYLCDVSQPALDRGMGFIRKFLEEAVQRKIFSPDAAKAIEARVKPTTALADTAKAELVIEAVFEDPKVKHDLFKQLDALCPPIVILASNTSSLLVTELAKATTHPERFGGLHYFYHPAKNRLVEIIPGQKTSTETVQKMVQFNKLLGKVAIVCKDRPGFVVNRFFVPWLNEAVFLLEEGVASIPTIEAVAKRVFQIGMGPFELMNVTGIPIAHHALQAMAKEMGEWYAPSHLLAAQVEKKALWNLEGPVQEGEGATRVERRLCGVVFALAGQIVDEEVCSREDVDRGAKVGLRWAEGPFEMMNRMGVSSAAHMVGEALVARKGLTTPSCLKNQATKNIPWSLTTVDLTVKGDVAVITLNRPEALNAINQSLMKDLDRAMTQANADSTVKGIVLEGAGKAFGAGADLKFFIDAMEQKRIPDIVTFTAYGHEVLKKIDDSPKRVVVKLHGPAIGGGAEIAMTADVLVASDRAIIGFPETGLGIYPGLGGTQRVPRRVGKELGRYLIFIGEMLNAKRAWEIGLLDEAVSVEALDERALALARGAEPLRAKGLPAWAEEMKGAFSDVHVHAMLTGQWGSVNGTVKKETVEGLQKKWGRKSMFALQTAHQLIEKGIELPLAGGLRLELDSLISIFAHPDAYERISKIGGKK